MPPCPLGSKNTDTPYYLLAYINKFCIPTFEIISLTFIFFNYYLAPTFIIKVEIALKFNYYTLSIILFFIS